MQTQCNANPIRFEDVDGRKVIAAFDGGAMTSDAGALLLRHADKAINLFERVSACFADHRKQNRVEHRLTSMLAQRIAGIALGYEDIEDHDQLRHDPVLALLAGRLEAKRADCVALAGKSTLNRLEHAPADAAGRYHRIGHDAKALEELFVSVFLEAHNTAPEQITLDLDATDDPLHGEQEGRFFHGYYRCYCYLPLYIFCGRHLLCAKLRRSNIDACAGAVEEVARIVGQIRQSWPQVDIVLRADSGFAREELMVWCEANDVDYVYGLARNKRLTRTIEAAMAEAKAEHLTTGEPARRFEAFMYKTRKSWSRERRVIAKVEYLPKGTNPRFIVTSLKADQHDARALYEKVYCARGEMENRIKECQLDLFADRTSARTMRANQLRLWFASFAYVLVDSLRRIALKGTQLQNATCRSIRLKLLKIGARVKVSVRRIVVSMASSHPYQQEFVLVRSRLSP